MHTLPWSYGLTTTVTIIIRCLYETGRKAADNHKGAVTIRLDDLCTTRRIPTLS